MKSVIRAVFALAFIGTAFAFFGHQEGAVYRHFREEPLEFTEQDLHLLADAFHIEAHYLDQKQNLLDSVQLVITNATNQTGEIGNLIDSTQGLIKVVKDAAGQLSNPGNLITNTLKSGWSKLFGRLLQNQNGVNGFIDSLNNKVSEAKGQQQTITSALSNSSKFLGALQGIGQLLSGNTSGFKSTLGKYFPSWFGQSSRRLRAEAHDGLFDLFKGSAQPADQAAAGQSSWFSGIKEKLQQQAINGALSSAGFGGLGGLVGGQQQPADQQAPANGTQGSSFLDKFGAAKSWVQKLSNLYQTAGAHLEHIAAKPDTSRGRHRKSLYQQTAERHRLERMANSLKDASRYLESVTDETVNFRKLENHLWDLVQDGGATGKAYLRGVETLKCILLQQNCPEIRVIPSSFTKNIYLGQNSVGGAASVALGNQIVTNGTDSQIKLVALNQAGNDYLNSAALGASSANNGFNPSQGNEAIIVTNESPVNILPPVSDVVSGVQYETLVNQPTADSSNPDMAIPKIGGAVSSSSANGQLITINSSNAIAGAPNSFFVVSPNGQSSTINTSNISVNGNNLVNLDNGFSTNGADSSNFVISSPQLNSEFITSANNAANNSFYIHGQDIDENENWTSADVEPQPLAGSN